MRDMKFSKEDPVFLPRRQDGSVFMNFVLFMVKSRYILAKCFNPGMLLTL